MIQVYIASTERLPDPLLDLDSMSSLPEERKEKIVVGKNVALRRQRLGAALLLGKILRGHSISWQEISFKEGGKPYAPKLDFNLSHSGDYAVVSVAERGAVGCDIQKMGKIPQKVLKRFFSRTDENSESVVDRSQFYRLWTRAESYLKMTGEGIGKIGEIEFFGEELYRKGACVQCVFRDFLLKEYALCVCSVREEISPNLTYVQIG